MLDDKFTEKVIIKIPDSTLDGVMTYQEYVGHAVVMENTVTLVEPKSKVILNRTFLVKTRCEPIPGAVIIYRDEAHHLKTVRTCRTLTGQLECYRCTS